jgi:glycosyltransferase involved in cell wall biosynthesis
VRTLPRISIVTPSYNQGAFLEGTIRSVLSQDYPNLEYLVIDGGSTDDSVSVIERYANRLAYWVSEPDRGQSHAINKGFARTSGDLLMWLNSDDRLEPGALRTVAEEVEQFKDAGAFVGEGRMVNTAGKVVYYRRPGELTFDGFCRWLEGGDFMQPSCFFRREAWEAAGPLDERLHISLDVDLWLRMVQVVKFHAINRLLSTSLAHEAAKTQRDRSAMIVEASIVIIRAGGQEAVRKLLVEAVTVAAAYERRRLANRPLVKFVRRGVRYLLRRAGIEIPGAAVTTPSLDRRS